jgi:hypothetical protein
MILTDDVLETPKIPHGPPGSPVNGFTGNGASQVCTRVFPQTTGSSAVMIAEIRTCIPVNNFFHRNRDYWQAYVKIFGILLRTNGVNALITMLSQEKCAALPSSGPDFTSSSLANLSNKMRNPMSKYV